MGNKAHISLHALFLSFIGCWTRLVHALCECGYSTNINISGGATNAFLFTDLLETDFIRGVTNIFSDTDWLVQSYNVSGAVDRGQYG
jgi:hypothetical protein